MVMHRFEAPTKSVRYGYDPPMKQCTKCKEEKDESNFFKKRNGLQSHCKKCQNEYTKNHYLNNKQYYKDKARNYCEPILKDLREFVIKEKSKPCVDCKKSFHPFCMDFDHRENEDKISEIATLVRQCVAIEMLKNEIAKCDLVCANCHRLRTFKRDKRFAKYYGPSDGFGLDTTNVDESVRFA